MLTISHLHSVLATAILLSLITGCATNASNTSSSNSNSSTAQKKISMAIGQEISDFTITNQSSVDAPAGYDGTQYSVKTVAGKTYKCEILEASGFGKVITFGTASGASAMCTDFTKGSAEAGKTNAAGCNALLKAANRC